MTRERFDIDLLDPEDPFEIDDANRPHLYKHLPTAGAKQISVGVEDLYDMYLSGNPLYYPASEEGEADWLLFAEVPGIMLIAPLAPPRASSPSICRPIGLYGATQAERERYLSDLREEEDR